MKDINQINIGKELHYMAPDIFAYRAVRIQTLNRFLSNPHLMKEGLAFTQRLLEEWKGLTPEDRSRRILSMEETEKFIDSVGIGELGIDRTFETDRVTFFLSFCLGLNLSKEDSETKAVFVNSFGDNDWGGFTLSFDIDKEVLKRIVVSEDLGQSHLMKYLTDRRHCNEGFEENYETQPLAGKLKEIQSPYLEGEFYNLHYFFGLPVTLLSKSGETDLLADLLLRYTLPNIQYQILTILTDPEEIIKLFSIVAQRLSGDQENTQIEGLLFIRYWFERMVRLTGSYNLEFTSKNPQFKDLWVKEKQRFEDGYGDLLRSGIETFVRTLGSGFVSEYLFQKKLLTPDRETEATKAHNKVLEDCKALVMDLIDATDFDVRISDLGYISSFLEIAVRNTREGDLPNTLLQALFSSLSQDTTYLSGPVNNALILKIHTISRFLTTNYEPRIEDIYKDRIKGITVIHEGINAIHSNFLNKTAYESQFLLIFLYISSYIQPRERAHELFKTITHHALRQCSNCQQTELIEDSYQRVLNFAELIADQCLPDIKSEFERSCIRLYPDFTTVVKVIGNSRRPVDTEVKQWISEKKETEWKIIKERILSRSQGDYHYRNYLESMENNIQRILDMN